MSLLDRCALDSGRRVVGGRWREVRPGAVYQSLVSVSLSREELLTGWRGSRLVRDLGIDLHTAHGERRAL